MIRTFNYFGFPPAAIAAVCGLVEASSICWYDDDVVRFTVGRTGKTHQLDLDTLNELERLRFVTLRGTVDAKLAGEIDVTDRGRYWAKRFLKANKIELA